MLDDLNIDRSTTAQRVADALRERMYAGELEPGTPLPEVPLAKSIGVSRSTVREAIQILAQDGLVVRSLYRGVVVTELTEPDVRDIYRARRLLELAGVAALGEDDPPSLEPLRETLERFRRAVDTADEAGSLTGHLEFHAGLVDLLRSRRLAATHDALMGDLRLALASVDRQTDVLAHHDSHRMLLELMARGDLETAQRELRAHLDGAEAVVLEHGRLRRDDRPG
jgi:DNA-binding GntR family transcriptional regulator